jgi:hypothetical protein
MTQRKRYYDPGAAPKPRRVEPSRGTGPIGNTRQQRRARARLSFEAQLTLAESVGFPVPRAEDVDVTMRTEWMAAWERAYATL